MTSSPYKSKVLNFVAAKYRQILTQSDTTLRHLKFAATNTVQLLLYPIYVLLQTSRLALKQLRQTTTSPIPQIAEKVNKKISENDQTPDQPIQEVSVISTQDYPRLLEPSKPKPLVKMQCEDFSGLEIAENHKISEILVRVKQENPLILQTAKIEKKVPLQLQPCTELVPMFGPLGRIWQIMAWVQTSKIALWFNLFEELNIALDQNESKHENNISSINYQSQPLLSSSNLTFSEFIHNLAKQYLYPITTGLGLNGLLPPFKIEEEWQLESLLEAELGQENQQKPLANQDETPIVASSVSPFEPETSQIATSLATKPLIRTGNIEKLGKEKNLPLDLPLDRHLSDQTILTSNNSNNSAKKEAIAFKEVLRDIDGHRIEQELNYSINRTKISVQSYNSQSRPKHQGNCLEVESVSVGYVKHPLEIILGWVDVIMTWLEKIFVQVWQLCQQKLKNF
ncbi:MAG: hypothetical protein F6K22_29660 [Okeania sp. SIO2F4]|uniref:hypothetical protein n=1 Tax=Okeania sp. SIO2F4 TaxID=2607790 RepID=UPI00142AB681|nr:hypothetical protein [Okeania sp. SIO2F4]NES06620.1 hypothetical protein [Okeania sp. SIO2F4]